MVMPLATRLRSTAMRVLSSPFTQGMLRSRARLGRRLRGAPRVVHYFHQVDDPYSHLAVQKLDAFRQACTLPVVPHLVHPPTAAFRGDEGRYSGWTRRDAASIAPWFGCTLPEGEGEPAQEQVRRANALLAPALGDDGFAATAVAVGEALWSGRELEQAVRDPAPALTEGTRLRDELGHYFGAMFHFEGEWYWGLDRLHLLETRLRDEGHMARNTPACAPLPSVQAVPGTNAPGASSSGPDARTVTLEYFPSLRSPYTAVGHARVLDVLTRTGVTLALRPVMPMMMRGVPAPLAKQRYIAMDAAREARFHGVPYGRMVDPFGEPVRRAFALYPAATRMGRGLEYVTAYLACAWAKGVDITFTAGLRRVAEEAGLDWPALQREAEGDDWQPVLEENVAAMLGAGLWGVPSFRVSGGDDPAPFACWGQDRIWRVEAEILRRCSAVTPPAGSPRHSR